MNVVSSEKFSSEKFELSANYLGLLFATAQPPLRDPLWRRGPLVANHWFRVKLWLMLLSWGRGLALGFGCSAGD